jgi:hypothetical protein
MHAYLKALSTMPVPVQHSAVDKNVAALTQNQAYNALLFLYKQVMQKDFGEIKDVPAPSISLMCWWFCLRPK